jgi:hypothetical protein
MQIAGVGAGAVQLACRERLMGLLSALACGVGKRKIYAWVSLKLMALAD